MEHLTWRQKEQANKEREDHYCERLHHVKQVSESSGFLPRPVHKFLKVWKARCPDCELFLTKTKYSRDSRETYHHYRCPHCDYEIATYKFEGW